ncbi:MAG: thioredoxin [Pseudoalteromonas sp.]|uniref:TlpA disulfide reductase family protein n=1 Tax=Pseudoalteromonas sp. TaxID=53249 RepID=UPI000C977B68|nr:TlpA disulfide reductase family protein [Pseudoalteromonas sp.]MAD04904.1 thioredoxin [Pseudoalteromonas sp.]|tara:strand:- start:52322 stop:52798 length:477 start_codon:yes stop_codon:yes gene_type:complete
MIKYGLIAFLLFACSAATAEHPSTAPLAASQQQLSKLLNQYKGKIVLLDFWASLCSPCRRSFPWFIAMQSKYQEQGLKVIAVNIDVERSDADVFLTEFAVNFNIIYDPDAVIGRQYQLKGMPSSFLIDKEGIVRYQHTGFLADKLDLYESHIKELIAN